jgi:cytochrome c556
MRLACAAVALAVAGGAALTAQKNPYLKYTEQHFVESMQTAGRNYSAVNDLLKKGDYQDAKAQLTRVREHLATTITYWRDNKKDDAIVMLRAALRALDDLDVALSPEKVDAAAVGAVSKRIDSACQACHNVYREQVPGTKTYRVKKL